MRLRGLRRHALALGDAADELGEVERLRPVPVPEEGPELLRQLLRDVFRLAAGQALGERLQRRADGPLGQLAGGAGVTLSGYRSTGRRPATTIP
jgi:hypothetical protein